MIISGTKHGWTRKKIITTILLVVSFSMLFLPWITISLNVMGQKLTVSKILNYVSTYYGYSSAQFKAELYNELVDISEDMAWEGVNMEPKQAMATLELIFDSNLSPIECARVFSFVSSIVGEASDYVVRNSQYLSGEERVLASLVTEAAGKIASASILIWVCIIVFVVGFACSLFLTLYNRKFSIAPYLCVSIVLLILFSVLATKVNSGINQLVSVFSYGVAGFLYEFGIDYSPSMDLSIFHLSLPGFLCLILAACASVLSVFSEDTTTHFSFPSVKAPRKWVCASCSSSMDERYSFCTNCGAKRGVASCCEKCGHTIGSDVTFCPYCGVPNRKKPDSDLRKTQKLLGTLVPPSDEDL